MLSTFTKGSGCYKCTSCGRMTRDTGDRDAVHARMCSQCFEASGLDNMISDGCASENDKKRYEDLKAEITKLGGKY